MARIVHCLGKKPVCHDKRTLMLKHLMPGLPAAPPARDWTTKLPADIGMLNNDIIGDCTIASAAHLVQVWSSQIGLIQCPTLQEVIAAYSAVSGYTPSDPLTDQGANMLDVLSYWRSVGIGGHKIGAFVKVDHTDIEHVKAAIDFFGGVYVGANLPVSAQDTSKPWAGPGGTPTGDNAPGSWGGHCMGVAAYDRSRATFLTWGKRQLGDWVWWQDYVDECYAIISPDWLAQDGSAPVGLPVDLLKTYLSALAG